MKKFKVNKVTKERVSAIFTRHQRQKEVFTTADGQIFLKEGFAMTHQKSLTDSSKGVETIAKHQIKDLPSAETKTEAKDEAKDDTNTTGDAFNVNTATNEAIFEEIKALDPEADVQKHSNKATLTECYNNLIKKSDGNSES